jgi:hypothetical protein
VGVAVRGGSDQDVKWISKKKKPNNNNNDNNNNNNLAF